jgi:hypothetical protein
MTTNDFHQLWKPVRPLATNNWEEGQFRMSRENAVTKRFIETTPKNYRNLMVLDVDEEQSEWFVKGLIEEEGLIPQPNYITINPSSEHAQIGYFIDGHIGTPKGIQFFNDVFESLKFNSKTDLAYGGRSMRNPLHDWQKTEWGTDHLYTLKELKEYCKKVRTPSQKAQEATGGRNTDTFNSLRSFGYKAFKHASKDKPLESIIWERALELNFSLKDTNELQLSMTELRSISNSVTKWIEKHFDEKAFSKKQAYRVGFRWDKNMEEREERNKNILSMIEAGFTVKEIAENMSMNYEATKTAVRRLKNKLKEQEL